MSNKVTGLEALSYLADVALAGDVKIIEHDAGIDVDNAGRSYVYDSYTDSEGVYWNALLYVGSVLPSGYTLDDLFAVEYDVERVRWFHINNEIFDGGESRGIHFEFLWPTISWVPVNEVQPGDEVNIFGFHEVDGKWFTNDLSGVHLSIADGADEKQFGPLPVTQRVETRRWR